MRYPAEISTTAAPSNNSRRIVSNALVLFVRFFILTCIGLYSVRIVLKGLGDVDYGIYSTVISIITTSAFVSGVLTLSVQRYLSYSIGKGETKKLQEIFSASINIVTVIAIIVIIVFEVLGAWFISNHLTIPEERMTATLQAFQFALFAFVCSLLQIPFTAAIFAHEDMGIYASISTIECILKLGAAYLMAACSQFDHLAYYAALLLFIAIVVLLSYASVAFWRYPECRYKKVKSSRLHQELLSFSGWTLLGSAANMGMIQGNMILLNIFFGPLVNAAFGIALQINNAFAALYNCIVLALRPAMIKSYADDNHSYLSKLFFIGNKLLVYILIAIAIPFILEMRSILNLWLGDVSETTVLFSRLIIIYIICIAMNLPITTIVQATGKLKEYHLPVEGVTLLCIPVTLILFISGLPSWSVFVSMVSVCVIAHIVRLFCLRRCYGHFSIRQYVNKLCIPAVITFVLISILSYFLHSTFYQESILRLAVVFTLTPVLLIVLVYVIGINNDERALIRQFAISKLRICRWNR